MTKHLLIIGTVWPEPASTAAGSRMLQLIEIFQKDDYKITFVSAALKNERSFHLENLDINTIEVQLNNSDFDIFIKELKPDIVLFDRFLTEEQYGWRIEENYPKAIRILDTEDLHFLRHARHEAYKDKETISLDYLTNDITKREIASIYRCDLSLIISKYEYDLLINTFKVDSSLLLYIPFLLNNIDHTIINAYPTFNERKHFMTIGNFKHEPNWNAVLHLKKDIWPNIRKKLPDVEMYIYGSYTTDKVIQLHNEKDGFLIKGWVNNSVEAFSKSKVCLAPIQFGAGLKGKLINAMQYGTPSVTTKIGSEAMHKKLPWNGFISDDFNDFVINAIELYNNEAKWYKAQLNGVSIINECYSKEKYTDYFLSRIKQIRINIKNHRLSNFSGAMLLHHTLRSTKYLSKWIEEKNSNS